MGGVFVFKQPPPGFITEYFGGGGKGGTSTSTVTIPPEILARYNAVNARAEKVATDSFQKYGGEFVAGLSDTQKAGIQGTTAAANQAQPYFDAATGLTASGAKDVGALTQDQIGYYQNPYTQAVVDPTLRALEQQQGQQRSQQQTQAIKSGGMNAGRSAVERALLSGQQGLATSQAIAPLYQQGYQQAVQTAQGQQGVVAADLARRMQAGQQIAGLGTGAQTAALQGAQAQMAAGQVEQQTKQAGDTAEYQQFLQERGYPYQQAQFLANIAMGTGALSGSTTTSQQPGGFFSDKRLKEDVKEIGKTNDGQPIYSYKYKGDDRTQIGLMAQDVEKKHPEAVGLMGGYKTVDYKKATEDAERPHKDMGGGLMPNNFDTSSMGGAVTSDMAGEGFMRGGYVGGGLVGNDDWSQIIAANKAALGVYGGAQPMGGGSPGATGIIPAASIPTPKLVVANAPPQQRPAGLSTAMQTGKDIAGAYSMGKSGLIGSPKTTADPEGSSGLIGGGGEWGGKNIFSKAKDLFAANGGLIVPRHAYADGGMSEGEEAIPYDPSDVMGGNDPMEGVLKAGSQKREMLKPSGAGGGGGGSSPFSSILGGIGAAKGVMEAGSWLGSTALPFLAGLSDARVKDNIRPVGKTFDGQNIYSYNIGEGPTQMGLMAQEVLDRKPEAVGQRAGLLTVDYDRATEDAQPYASGGLVPRQGYDEGGPADTGSLFSSIEKKYELPEGYLNRTWQIESGGGKNLYNEGSKAAGHFQFIPGTQKMMGLQNPYDLSESADATARLAAQNREYLRKGGVEEPTAAHLYLAHQQGPLGATRLLNAADRPAGLVVGEKAVTGNRGDPNARGLDFANQIMAKYEGTQGPGSGPIPAAIPRPPGLVGEGMERTASGGEGKKSLGDTLTSEGFVVPALGFLGSMLASNKPNLGQALGEGIMGGVGAYQQQRKMLPEVAKAEAEATQLNVAAINALSTGLKQYNAMNGTNLTLQQFAKLNPAEIARYAGAEAASAVAGKSASSGGYSYTPEEMESLVIKRPGQPDIPASMDPGYLNSYKANYAKWGDNPYAKSQIAFADKQIEKTGATTLSSTGERIPAPGAIETAQKGEVGKGLAKEALDFNQEKRMFMQESPKILTSVNQIADIVSRFPTGADVTARANLDRIMKSIDPKNEFGLWTGAAGDYDTMVKNAMIIGLSQLKGLSPRAPAAELEAIKRQIPEGKMDPEAIRNILSGLKADVEYKKKMYNSFDIDKHTNVNKVLSEFMEKEPYEEFVKQTKKELKPGAGTQQQREQAAIPQSDLVAGKVYKDASGVQKKWTGSGWENP